jgi:hypothetical protein
MKKLIRLLILMTFPFIMNGCMSTLTLPVLQPAQINLPGYYEKLAIVHRHRASKENTALNILEGVLTGESPLADREAGKYCLNGVKDALLKTPRYVVVEPPGLDLRGTGTGTFPPPLSWEEVENICINNGADALIVLEIFDSNSAISYTSKPVTVKNKEGVESTITEHYANMRMTVTSGWRIYDYKYKIMVDEFRGDNWMNFSAKGTSPQHALAALIAKREAMNRTGFYAGSQYGFRIAPQWINVSREYYTKGSPNLKKAARMARTNNWQDASDIWRRMSVSPSKKTAKRSTYNMAVASEVLGDLDAALDWANKAYREFNSRPALRYSSVLRQRIRDNERVNEQMK